MGMRSIVNIVSNFCPLQQSPHHHALRDLFAYIDSLASLSPGTYPVLTPRTHSISGPSSTPLPAGHIYRINTGSPLPLGTDAVVMVEDTELVRTTRAEGEEEEELEVKLLVGATKGENVRQPGSDTRVGERVMSMGTRVSERGGEIGTLAFVGKRQVRPFLISFRRDADLRSPMMLQVKVHRKPRVALLSTGNEIVDIQGATPNSAHPESAGAERGRDGWTGTFDTNRPSLEAALKGLGYDDILDCGIVSDTCVLPLHIFPSTALNQPVPQSRRTHQHNPHRAYPVRRSDNDRWLLHGLV